MKKKDTLKNLLSYLPVATLGVGLLIGGVRFQLQAENTKTEVKDLKAEVKEVVSEADKEIKDLKDKDQKLENAVIVAQVKQEEISRKVEDTNQKVDKIIDLLLQMQKKK